MNAGSNAPRLRANVYVDGFNLYYGCLKHNPDLKWLDLAVLFRKLLPQYQIHRIRYFTARVSARPSDPDAPTRQDTYLRALETLPNVTVHLGHFLMTTPWMRLAEPPATGAKTVKVIKTEEKGSDVNLATYLLIDAVRSDCEVAIVVSNDSDLYEPIRIVQLELKVPVGILNPHPKPSQKLKSLHPLFIRPIRRGPLSASQFPTEIADAKGKIVKPAGWRPAGKS